MNIGELLTSFGTGGLVKAMREVDVTNVLKGAGICVGAYWALRTFTVGNRLKSAELLVQVERDYQCHIPVLLQIERRDDYTTKFLLPIRKTLAADGCGLELKLSPAEQDAMDELESILRYFHVCCNIRQLGIHSGAVEQLCYYYLKVLISRDRHYRKDLHDYVRYYWPSVYLWSELVLEPWPKRFFKYLRQLRLRGGYWWKGTVAWRSTTGLNAANVCDSKFVKTPSGEPAPVQASEAGGMLVAGTLAAFFLSLAFFSRRERSDEQS